MKRITLKHLCMLLCLAVFLLSFSTIAYAHPGRTDSNGGHYDHSTGEYHYHGTPDSDSSSGTSSSGSGSSYYGDNGMEPWEIVCIFLFYGSILIFIIIFVYKAYNSRSDNTVKKSSDAPQPVPSPPQEKAKPVSTAPPTEKKDALRDEYNSKYDKLRRDLQQQVAETNERNNNLLISKLEAIDREKVALALEKDDIEKAIEFSKEQLSLLPIDKHCNIEEMYNSIISGRLNNAFDSNLSLADLKITCRIRSEDKYYKTSLSECSCIDFQTRHSPCKHMLFLAYNLGILQINRKYGEKSADQLIESINQESQKLRKFKKQISSLEKKIK